MNTAEILSRLDGVKSHGQGAYLSRCPAHDDRSPSLGIKEAEDGKTLLHCFAGCEIEEVAAAIGLTLTDLFPDSIKASGPAKRKFPAHLVLQALDVDLRWIRLVLHCMAKGETLGPEEHKRLDEIHARVSDAIEASK